MDKANHPFNGGSIVTTARNAMLPALRTSKEHGQSNFNNRLRLIGVGADFDILPELRVSTNVNYMEFDDTSVLEVARNQQEIAQEIGLDVSVAAIYRPFFTQNVVFRLSGAALFRVVDSQTCMVSNAIKMIRFFPFKQTLFLHIRQSSWFIYVT